MALTLSNPSMIKISYNTREEFEAASIPSVINYVMAEGLLFERDATGTALTAADGSTWSPTLNNVTPLHWGADGTGVTDSADVFDTMLAWTAVKAATLPWKPAGDRSFDTRIVISGANSLYALSRTIWIEEENSRTMFQNMDVVAIGTGWETAGGTDLTEYFAYRPHKSDFMFNCRANATYVIMHNVNLNCSNLCGGVKLRHKGRFWNGQITKCAGIGVECEKGDVWVAHSILNQWDQNDPEFYDPDAYTGIMVFSDNSDMLVTGCKIRWARELVRWEATNCNMWDTHLFNGCEGYKAADRSAFSADMLEAMDDYFGAGTDWDTHDFTGRTYHPFIVTAGSSLLTFKDNSVNDCYVDNAHAELYADRISFNNIQLAADDSITFLADGMPDYWFRLYCNDNGATPQCRISVDRILVEDVTKQIVKTSSYNGNTWGIAYGDFESSALNNGIGSTSDAGWGDGFRYGKPGVTVNSFGGNRFERVHNPAASGGFMEFSDKDTSKDTSDQYVGSLIGGWAGETQVRQLTDFTVYKREVNGSGDPTGAKTELARVTEHGCLRLPRHSSEPTAINGDIANSDGTSSTNNFGASGPGMYIRIAGSWVQM